MEKANILLFWFLWFDKHWDFLHFQEMLNGGELLGNRIVNLDSVTRMSSNQVGSLYYGKAKRGDDTNSEGFDTLYLLHWTAKILQYHTETAGRGGVAAHTHGRNLLPVLRP